MSTPRLVRNSLHLIPCCVLLLTLLPHLFADGTTQLHKDITISSTTSYTIAASDTAFELDNVDSGTSAQINIFFPSNGVVQPGLTITIKNCDLVGNFYFLARSVGANMILTGGATVNIHSNSFGALYAFGGINNAHTATATLSGGSTFNVYDNSMVNLAVGAALNGAESDITLSGNSQINIYNNIASNGIRVFVSRDSTAKMEVQVESGSKIKIFDNHITGGDGDYFNAQGISSTFSLTVTGAGSEVEIHNDENIGAVKVLNNFPGTPFDLTITAGGKFQYTGNTQTELFILSTSTGAGGSMNIDITNQGEAHFSSNTVTTGEMRVLEAASTATSFDLSGQSQFFVQNNVVTSGVLLFTVTVSTGSLTMLVTNSEIHVQGNLCSGGDLTVFNPQAAGGDLTATATTASTITISGNSIPSGSIFVYKSDGSTVTALTTTISVSSQLLVNGNNIGTSLRVGDSLAGSSLVWTISTSSICEVAFNDVGDALSFIRPFANADPTLTMTSSSKIEIHHNLVTSTLTVFDTDGVGCTTTVSMDQACSLLTHFNTVSGSSLWVGRARNDGSVSLTASKVCLIDLRNNAGATTIAYMEDDGGGATATSTMNDITCRVEQP